MMLSCRLCRPLPLATVQRRHMSGAFRIVPSPLHGTSQSTRSNAIAEPSCQAQGLLDTGIAWARAVTPDGV